MKRAFVAVGFLLFSLLGGAIGQNLAASSVGVAAYQMLSVWTGVAGTTIPPWPNSHFGFGGVKTSSQAVTPFASVSGIGGWGGYFASRTSDWTGAVATYPSALNHLCVVDSDNVGIWCQYLQGEMLTSSSHQLLNVENSVFNTVTPITNIDPFRSNNGNLNANYRMDCGTTQVSPTPTNCSTALQILNNGAKYANAAIIIGSDAMDTSIYANPPTIAMPTQDAIAWYSSAGTLGARMFAGAGSPAGVVSCTDRCLYLRTDGGAGSTLYVNETGGGTAGWAAK